MYRFFLQNPPDGNTISITGADAAHIRLSLRMKPGEEVIFTREGVDYLSEITEITPNEVISHIIKADPVKSEPALKLTLFFALPKSDKAETIIQKCTELGISEFVPFLTKRCVAVPKALNAKTERWQRVAESAAKQSGRGIIPTLSDILRFEEVLTRLSDFDAAFFCNENSGERLTLPDNVKNAALITGAEGGFELSEAERILTAGAKSITLGSRILRCETAPISAAAIIFHLSGDI
ncbi:MAG: 16S rRNA (uracil(1498)-N(3))-methyltransferase [Ruminococcus sp.]|jgi:16S rRNA (uracil1498-N3)-methyltransferase|nr:16S rRNA (uracil(1498)-N(3))-methyltransferase [Ruminococcus sp.]